MIEMNELAQKTLKIALKYVDDAEIYVESEKMVNVDIQNDQVNFAKEVSSYGVGIRVIFDNKMGFAYTTNLNEIEQSVKNAIFNAKFNEADENFIFASKSDYPHVEEIYDPNINDLDLQDTVKFAESMIQTSQNMKCEPTSGGVSAGILNSVITNSDNVFSSDSSTSFSGSISVNIPDGDGISTASEFDSSCFMELNPESIAEKACNIALDSRNGKSIETGNMDIILDYNAAAALIYILSNSLNADNVQRGRSVYADKLGEKISASSLNIYDDGTLKRGLNSAQSDGEGTPSQKTMLIEKGFLKNFIYDLYTSKKGGVKSTGNGIRSSFADVPSVGFSNLILDFEEVKEISNIKKGLMVRDLMGAHTANPISGDFSVEAMNAFYIEKGEIKYPVKKAMISGNVFNAFENVSASSIKTKQVGPFILPQINVPQLRVVG